MNQNPHQYNNLIDDQIRNNVYNDLFAAIYDALKKEEITEDEAQNTAEFILPRLDSVKTKDELIAFLSELAEKWPVYSNVYLLTKSEHDNQVKLAQLHQEVNTLIK